MNSKKRKRSSVKVKEKSRNEREILTLKGNSLINIKKKIFKIKKLIKKCETIFVFFLV